MQPIASRARLSNRRALLHERRWTWTLSIVCGLLLTPSPRSNASTPPPIDLPEGLVAEVAAAPPVVMHPIMASLGDRGQLFVGDSSGVNLNKAGLEKELPHRVLLLRDTDGDGVYDRSTVFADKMTFPQGGVWLDGSFYVASPPGIWKLTDTDGDGVADHREMIVGGFEYTGNAADVHGPFLHPNGRLYWCHGRKGHEVKQKDGTLVHAGLASGIWSCRPDGSDVQWHALSCADNPTEIDFTPEGEIVGTVNLFYNQPRGDTIIHWLHGGVYPREDQLQAIEGLPRTLEVMPVMHNFGHVAVSGCAFYRSGVLHPGWRGNLFVVHFNTQRVTRLELIPDGATYRVIQREFLKLRDPDAHLTDVLEDRDGSLLVLDTGGWFRAGCPSSLVAKPDVAGAIYRIRTSDSPAKVQRWGGATEKVWELARRGDAASVRELVNLLSSRDVSVARAAGNALAMLAKPEAEDALTVALRNKNPGVQLAAANALGSLPHLGKKSIQALLAQLESDVEREVEHQSMYALLRANQPAPLLEALGNSHSPALQRRALIVLDQLRESPLNASRVVPLLHSHDALLSATAAGIAAKHRDWMGTISAEFSTALHGGKLAAEPLALVERAVKPWLAESSVRDLVSTLLEQSNLPCRQTAWRLIASSDRRLAEARWNEPMRAALESANPADLVLVLEAVGKLRSPELESALKLFASDAKQPLTLRVKALGIALQSGGTLPVDSFALLLGVLGDSSSAAARLEAARVLGSAKMNKDQLVRLTHALGPLGPLELREVMRPFRAVKDLELATAFAEALKQAVALGSFQESEIRTLFSSLPEACYAIISATLRALAEEDDARRRKLETLPAQVVQRGHAEAGRKIFESGKGACSSCHRVGAVGNLVGPNLSAIGQIRSERDLLESILFPNATLARDYEAHSVEVANGDSFVGVIHRNLPDSVVIADATGQEHTLERRQIADMQTLPTSLMPSGLDRTLTEEELLDLVAFLRSRR